MKNVYLSLGSNLGNSKQNIQDALEELKELGALQSVSRFYETEPWGVKDQPWFLNMCAGLETALPPNELFAACQKIEKKHGRERRKKWGPRPLDIDILFYDSEILETTRLTIPHPGIAGRRFVLLPLAEIAPNFVHPVSKKTISQLLKECPDTSIVRPLS